MIIVCQKCTKRYHVDAVSLGDKGRKVRCVACGYLWFQASEAPLLPLSEERLTPPLPAPSFLQRFLWLFVKILLVCVGVGGVLMILNSGSFKNVIVAYIPQIQPLYDMMGAAAEQREGVQLDLRHITIEPMGGLWPGAQEEGAQQRLYSFKIKGSIVNTSDRVQPLPALKIQLKGKCVAPEQVDSCLLQEWTHSLSQPQILPGEVIQFEISVEHPHPPGGSFSVSF